MALVTAVVCAAFDAATDEAVLAVRSRVQALGVQIPDEPAHRPHMTLTAARVQDADLPLIFAVVAAVAARHEPFAVELTEVNRFTRGGVLWLGPRPMRELPDLQRDVYRTMKRSGWEPAFAAQTTPHRWVAHCTLATRLTAPLLRSVQETLLDECAPITGQVTALATILVGGHGDVDRVSLGAQAAQGPVTPF